MSNIPDPAYARHRTVTEVLKLAAEKGFKVDAMRHTHSGSDYITVYMPGPGNKLVPVMYNVYNGRFFSGGREAFSYFSSDEVKNEDQPWFQAMLEFFYVPLGAEVQS